MKSLNSDVLKNYNFEQVQKKIKIENEKVDLKKLWIFSQNNITFLDDINNWSKIINSTIDLEKHNIPDDLKSIEAEKPGSRSL